jgi:predicted phosphodiesterase
LRIFAVSDIHIDFIENRRWLYGLSNKEFINDILILAGDVTNKTLPLIHAFLALKKKFRDVHYVPGNHDLWANRNTNRNSLDNFILIRRIADNCGIKIERVNYGNVSVIPLYAWYDYSFGAPSDELRSIWMDYAVCKWPEGYDDTSITKHFISMNESALGSINNFVISFSHFLPRIDLMPVYIPQKKRILFPVLGTSLLEGQIRQLGSDIHIYGHSHVNVKTRKQNILYINNAFGYPSETAIAAKKLLKIYEE